MPLIQHISTRCWWLASDYLVHTNKFHRWCAVAVAGVVALLIGCFIAFAVAEKYQLKDSFFYGALQFSFIDGGYPETFAYGLELAASMIFVWIAWVHHKKHWYAFAGILLVVFFDDAFQLHETIGHSLVVNFSVSPSVGDLGGFATTGLLSAVFWVFGVLKIESDDELCAYLLFTVYFAILIFFGVGVDALHGMFNGNGMQTLFTLLEDGGELVMTAVLSLSALGMLLRQRQSATAAKMPINSIYSKL